jgi:peptide deformylase
MARLQILRYPDPRLYKQAAAVTSFDGKLRELVRDMAETMYEAPGIGLAATQVDVHRQVIVMDTSEDRNNLITLINPEILERDGTQFCEEGCLSVPGIYDEVERAAWIKVRAQDVEGKSFLMEADKLVAVCIQHEMDHLRGKVFVDYLSRLKQSRIKAKMQKLQPHDGE